MITRTGNVKRTEFVKATEKKEASKVVDEAEEEKAKKKSKKTGKLDESSDEDEKKAKKQKQGTANFFDEAPVFTQQSVVLMDDLLGIDTAVP